MMLWLTDIKNKWPLDSLALLIVCFTARDVIKILTALLLPLRAAISSLITFDCGFQLNYKNFNALEDVGA